MSSSQLDYSLLFRQHKLYQVEFWQKSELEGYTITLYMPNEANVKLGITDNNDLAVKSNTNKRIILDENNEISLGKSIQKNLPEPFSDCEEKSSLSVKGSDVNYLQLNCIEVCYNRVMGLICKCEWPGGCPIDTDKLSFYCKNALQNSNSTLIKADCFNKCPLAIHTFRMQSSYIPANEN